MAYIKHTAIHTTPRAHLRYILNPGKNEDMKYSTAICCTNDYASACEDFKEIYEAFAKDRFDNRTKNKYESVRIHSYIQSFDESVSPETAHQIGVEWARAMFGEDRPVIISTHTNTGHCHNHIAVCAYDVKGNRWFGDRITYNLAREVSDRVCLEHGLKIIKNSKKHSSIKYKEWDSRKKGCSWKVKMADVIDRLIVRDDVSDITSLIEKMRESGYVFTNEKRMIAKPANVKYGCSIAKLGYGYSMEMLQTRIANKQNEFAGIKISAFLGVQVDYAVTIREKQIELYRSRSVSSNISYAEVKRTMELLNYVHDNHIHSVDDMKAVVDKAKAKAEKLYNRYDYLCKEKKLLEQLKNFGNEYHYLVNKTDRTNIEQKQLEELYRKFLPNAFLGRGNYGDPDWVQKQINQIQSDLRGIDSVYAELKKANSDYYRAWNGQELLERTLETDFDRIRKQEHLRKQIEMYHQGYELQDDGTYVNDSDATAVRNAELDYLAEIEAEKKHWAEMEYLLELEKQEERERQERAKRKSYDYSR